MITEEAGVRYVLLCDEDNPTFDCTIFEYHCYHHRTNKDSIRRIAIYGYWNTRYSDLLILLNWWNKKCSAGGFSYYTED